MRGASFGTTVLRWGWVVREMVARARLGCVVRERARRYLERPHPQKPARDTMGVPRPREHILSNLEALYREAPGRARPRPRPTPGMKTSRSLNRSASSAASRDFRSAADRPRLARSQPAARGRSPLAVVFVTVFLDLVGFGIVIPLLPLYAERF